MSSASDSRTLVRHPAFQAVAEQGALRRAVDGTRVSKLSLELVHGLHAATVEQFHENAADVLYRFGYEWGLQDMVEVNQRLRDEFGGSSFDIWQTDTKFVFTSWWNPLQEAGWGQCTFGSAINARGTFLTDLRGSVVAAALAGSDEPVCHLYAGLFAGVASFFDRTERHSVELQCAASGAPHCQFLVGTGADIDSAEAWRQQGVPPAEILQRLR
jgi:uncharacterized protein